MTKSRNGELPPHDDAIEAACLGCLLANPEAAALELPKINLADFYDVRHRHVYRAMAGVLESGSIPDSIRIYSWLKEHGTLKEWPEAMGYISGLPDHVPGSPVLDYYLRELKDKSNRRALKELGQMAIKLAGDEDVDSSAMPDSFNSSAQAILSRISNSRLKLPQIQDARALLDDSTPPPAELIKGLVHEGTKLVLGGGSKSYKSWSFIDMACSIATGTPFWNFDTVQSRVLYINLEIPSVFFKRRIAAVLEAKQITLEPGQLDHWCLRGHAVCFDELLSEFVQRLKGQGYKQVIIDPVYKILGARDENAAGDIASLCNGFEKLAVESGANVSFGAHFSKGNQSSKEAIDRISGSGVFARDPDTILTLTRHEEDGAYVVEPTLRNFPPVAPFCLRWGFPLMRPVDLDPSKLKQVKGRPGRGYGAADVLKILPADGLSSTDWQEVSDRELGIGRSKFYELRRELEQSERIFFSKASEVWQPITK